MVKIYSSMAIQEHMREMLPNWQGLSLAMADELGESSHPVLGYM